MKLNSVVVANIRIKKISMIFLVASIPCSKASLKLTFEVSM